MASKKNPVSVQIKWNGENVKGEMIKTLDASMRDAAEELLKEANQIVPHDTGELMTSGRVRPGIKPGLYEIVYGSPSVPYAVYLHENPQFNFQQGRQGKWMESTIKNHGDRVLEAVKRKLK